MSELARPDSSRPRDDAPLVTFFVMAYRQERTVREAVESAFAQTYEPLEIFLSDDASPDRTFEIMQEMAAAYRGPHRVVLNRNPTNLGIVAHINRIMQIASGRLVVQNAGDDVSVPHRVERLVDAWEESGRRAHLLYSAARLIDAESRPGDLRYQAHPTLLAARSAEEVLASPRVALGATAAWTREPFERFGPIPPAALIEDQLLTFRSALLGPIVYVEEDLLLWRTGGLSNKPQQASAQDRLFGGSLRLVRWRAAACRAFLEDLRREDDRPDVVAARRAAEAQAVRHGLQVGLADAGTLGRLARLPQALRLALRMRSARPVTLTLQYLLNKPYIRWWEARHGRGSAAGRMKT